MSLKQYTKKLITEAIAYWEKQLVEARHDGSWLPKHPTHRNPTDKPTIYYLGVDDSDDFRGYGSYIMPNGNLTHGASNGDFKSAAVTKVPSSLKGMIDKALAKYGKDKYIFVFKEEYTYGTLTHKSHARPSVIDVWYPNGQYWRYSLAKVDALQESIGHNLQHDAEWQKLFDWFNANGYDMEDDEDLLLIEGDMFLFKEGHVPPGLSLTCTFDEAKAYVDNLSRSLAESVETKVLRMSCSTNPDFSGTFYKYDVEEEMKSLDIDVDKAGPNEWMSYVFGHTLSDSEDWTAALEDTVLLDNVKKIVLTLSGSLVVIEKK